MVDAIEYVTITLHTLEGEIHELPPFPKSSLVKDLAKFIRDRCACPISTQKLMWNEEVLTDTELELFEVFGAAEDVELMLVQIPRTPEEQAQVNRHFVREVAEGSMSGIQESLAEGAEVNPADEGALTPLMMAIAANDLQAAQLLRDRGAVEPDMQVQHATLALAFENSDLVDAIKHIAAGADVNTKLMRGQGIRATSSGYPLHACCALHTTHGSYELAQLLLRKKANVGLGDAEGDTPLAHAKYFHAPNLFLLLESNGAKVQGPYYKMFGRS